MIRTVIFDLGGVFIGIDAERSAIQLHKKIPHRTPKEIQAIFAHSSSLRTYEKGQMSSRQFYQAMKNELNGIFSYPFFKRAWQNIFYPIRPMIELLPELRKSYQLVLLSNTNPLHIAYIQKNYNILDYFQHTIFSYKSGCLKPDEHIFRLVLKLSQIPPNEAIFIDDKLENVMAAYRLGILSFQFQSAQVLLPSDRNKEPITIRDLLLGHYFCR